MEGIGHEGGCTLSHTDVFSNKQGWIHGRMNIFPGKVLFALDAQVRVFKYPNPPNPLMRAWTDQPQKYALIEHLNPTRKPTTLCIILAKLSGLRQGQKQDWALSKLPFLLLGAAEPSHSLLSFQTAFFYRWIAGNPSLVKTWSLSLFSSRSLSQTNNVCVWEPERSLKVDNCLQCYSISY